jgi:hypothetical protein
MPKSSTPATDKPRRGRPPGSKNKPKTGAAAKSGKASKASGGSMMDELLAFMRQNPKAVFADAKAAMAKSGHSLFPISWGRAQALLGRVKSKPRGAGKAAKSPSTPVAGAADAPVRRGPGRPRKYPVATPTAAGAPIKRGPGRPRKNPVAAAAPAARANRGSDTSIPVASADMMSIQAFVDAVNRGGKVQLRYGEGGWVLAAG